MCYNPWYSFGLHHLNTDRNIDSCPRWNGRPAVGWCVCVCVVVCVCVGTLSGVCMLPPSLSVCVCVGGCVPNLHVCVCLCVGVSVCSSPACLCLCVCVCVCV